MGRKEVLQPQSSNKGMKGVGDLGEVGMGDAELKV